MSRCDEELHFGGPRFCHVSSLNWLFTSSLKWSKAEGPVPAAVSKALHEVLKTHTAKSILLLMVRDLIDLAIHFLNRSIERWASN